ncbi:MAG TPA: right-handed parallel beta-helix repeat-containing protein [Burkholderiaceae bacterium]|nr:right-handed parallel beta-helix repeat-containing protein [Burkholderiaceae bacterium]
MPMLPDPPNPPRRWLRWVLALLLLCTAAALAGAAYLLRNAPVESAWKRTPMELVRYAERRLQGHPRLERLFVPTLERIRRLQEREPPASLPTLGKGQQEVLAFDVDFDATGRPRLLPASAVAARPTTTLVRGIDELQAAFAAAAPGQVIELAPGRYAVARTLHTARAGLPERPIVVRAAKPGTVEMVVTSQVGVDVTQPHWVFMNLAWRGACAQHDDCEHAFHVSGAGRGTAIVNNRIADFNAHVKVNGVNGAWPDDGLLQFNTLANTKPRSTALPVNGLDLVGANGWQVLDNAIERIVKDGGDRIAYGLCVKGAGSAARIERNLVVCTPERLSQPGLRVGISLGCGATGQRFCRDGRCEAELIDSVVANNVVAHCNDFGIDLHRVRGVQVAHNTLVNTEGIDARHASTRALAVGNLIEGRMRSRDGAALDARDNVQISSLDVMLNAPHALDLRWLEASNRSRSTPETARDFCGRTRPPFSPPGATVQARCDEGAAAKP